MTDTMILDKVRKLLKLAGNNPNPEEAATAAAMAQRLLDQHQLSAAMLDLETPSAAPTPDEPIENYGLDAPLDAPGRDRARVRLASVLAHANGCRIYTWGAKLCLIGRPLDAEAVRYLFAWVNAEMQRLADAHGRGKGLVWRSNFKLGIVDTVQKRLREERTAMRAEARESATHNPHALMVVNQALATLDARRASVDVWTAANMKFTRRGRSSSGQFNGGARAAGQQAGEGIALRGGRPLTSGAARLTR